MSHPIPPPRLDAGSLGRILAWLISDTLRQAWAARLTWLMLAALVLCWLLCASISVVGVARAELHRDQVPGNFVPPRPGDPTDKVPEDVLMAGGTLLRGDLTFGFGLFPVPFQFRDKEEAVHFVHTLLGQWGAGTAGLLLALVWTAGFLPTFLEPASATVLLAKPVPRWTLLAGKCLGTVVFMALFGVLFFGGTWWFLGLRTNVWDGGYLLAGVIWLVHFVVIYSASVYVAVVTRSTVLCVFGSVLFWMICLAVNYARHSAVAFRELAPEMPGPMPITMWMLEPIYWCLPKPADLMMLLEDALRSSQHFMPVAEYEKVRQAGMFYPVASVVSSIVSSLVVFVAAAWEFERIDY
jgi:ABC-type transport system involved in multi-copper enzyme maturation permease subunit